MSNDLKEARQDCCEAFAFLGMWEGHAIIRRHMIDNRWYCINMHPKALASGVPQAFMLGRISAYIISQIERVYGVYQGANHA